MMKSGSTHKYSLWKEDAPTVSLGTGWIRISPLSSVESYEVSQLFSRTAEAEYLVEPNENFIAGRYLDITHKKTAGGWESYSGVYFVLDVREIAGTRGPHNYVGYLAKVD